MASPGPETYSRRGRPLGFRDTTLLDLWNEECDPVETSVKGPKEDTPGPAP